MTHRLFLHPHGTFKRHNAAYRAVLADLREHVAAGKRDEKRERKRRASNIFKQCGETAGHELHA